MRNFDNLYNVAENGWTAAAQSHGDPIFTPLFTAIGFTGAIQIGSLAISTASIASAIATTCLTYGIHLA